MKMPGHAPRALVAALVMHGSFALIPAGGAPYELIAASSINRSSASALGVFLLERATNVVAARSDHFIMIGPSRKDVAAAAEEAGMAYDRIRRVFPGDTGEQDPAWLVFVHDEALWAEMVRTHRLREDGLALQAGRELYFNHRSTNRPDRVFHEMVHLRLREVFGPDALPLWMEEGLAAHYGWRHAIEFHHRKGYVLRRDFPSMPADQFYALPELMDCADYPDDPLRARIFYRQTEVLVGLLAERMGRDGLAALATAMSVPGKDTPPIERFRRASGLDAAQEDAMVDEVRNRMMLPPQP